MCVVVRNPVISVSEETGRKYYQEVRKKKYAYPYCYFTTVVLLSGAALQNLRKA
jgi:hypothetical protein